MAEHRTRKKSSKASRTWERLDGLLAALLGSIDIAFGKARTAVLFGMNSEAMGEFCKPDGPSPGLELTNGTLVVFAGGVPIRGRDGGVIGSIGVSVEQDLLVARAAASAAQSLKA